VQAPDEYGFCSIWLDSLEQYVYAVGLLMYDDLDNLKDTISQKNIDLGKREMLRLSSNEN
jgi:hypothetical protein